MKLRHIELILMLIGAIWIAWFITVILFGSFSLKLDNGWNYSYNGLFYEKER